MGSGPGRWLCSLTTPGSVEVPSSPRTTSWPPLTASMAPATTTSWPEPTTSESPPNPTELKSPHLTDGTTHNGTPTPSPTTLPSSTTSSPAVFHPSETPPIPMSSSPPPDGENPPITPEESPPSSEWSRIFPSSPTLNVTPSTELSETVLFALTLPEEREHATETPVAH